MCQDDRQKHVLLFTDKKVNIKKRNITDMDCRLISFFIFNLVARIHGLPAIIKIGKK